MQFSNQKLLTMISKALLKELDQILQEEYNVSLHEPELADLGEFLLRYFQTLIDIEKDYEERTAERE